MAKVVIKESGETAGVWVSEGSKQIGIVAQDGIGAYIAFYDTEKNLVPVALTIRDTDEDGNNELVVQLPEGGPLNCKLINISKLLGAMDGKSS